MDLTVEEDSDIDLKQKQELDKTRLKESKNKRFKN